MVVLEDIIDSKIVAFIWEFAAVIALIFTSMNCFAIISQARWNDKAEAMHFDPGRPRTA